MSKGRGFTAEDFQDCRAWVIAEHGHGALAKLLLGVIDSVEGGSEDPEENEVVGDIQSAVCDKIFNQQGSKK